MKTGFLVVMFGVLAAATPVFADPHELRVPLHDGRLELADLSALACQGVHLPPLELAAGAINLRGWRGSLFLGALNSSLGDGFHVTVTDSALIFRVDPQRLPLSVEQSKKSLRTFVAAENPRASAAQELRFGLFLPPSVDVSKNLVLLIHGLDCDASMVHPMGVMLEEHGLQVAYFSYPADQPIADDVTLLKKDLSALRARFPGIRLDLVGHSMGGLIARAYVEGNTYAGDVDHLILVGTPNSGSQWAHLDPLLKAQKQYYVSRSDPNWHWSWIITDGLGEGAHDVLPNSSFLRQLNAQPRRAGVHYTIIAGSHSAVATFESNWLHGIENLAPTGTRNWFGVEQVENGLARAARHLSESTGHSDGPVSIRSAKLAGVKDVVIVPADHASLFIGSQASPPAALPVILDRLGASASAQ